MELRPLVLLEIIFYLNRVVHFEMMNIFCPVHSPKEGDVHACEDWILQFIDEDTKYVCHMLGLLRLISWS